ncbi:ribbon-helix-helix protein, CopG family [Parasphingorhabdus sp.]
MRGQIHHTPVRFRVNEAILAKAQAKAERQGMSLSELLRHALRAELEDAA